MSESDAHPPHALGRWGEERASRFLSERGWTVLARNYHFGRREVDLVVRMDDLVAFVEVKTRAGDGYGAPGEAVTALKRREIETVALQFLTSQRLHDVGVRFDVISIVVDRDTGSVELEHIEDAWRPGGP